MEPNIEARIAQMEAKLDEVHRTTRKLYRIFLWTGIVTVASIVIPLILAAFALPTLLAGFTGLTGMEGFPTGF
jgi:hypothetical protein